MLVVANETMSTASLVDAVRAKATEGFWRFTLVVPAGDGERAPAERRLQYALAILAEAGIDASGAVQTGGPLEAVKAVADEENPSSVILATYPTSHSGWQADDIPDRMRKLLRLPVDRVVVTPEAAHAPIAVPGVHHVVVIAASALGDGLDLRARGPHRRRQRRSRDRPGSGRYHRCGLDG